MNYDLRDEKQAKEYIEHVGIEYRFQCYHEKSPEACHRLADFLDSVKREFDKSAALYKVNCDESNYGHSCLKFGNYRLVGKAGEKNLDVALQYYLKGCDNGYSQACHNAALLLNTESDKYKVANRDPEKAVQLLQQACAKNLVDSCHYLSGWFISGTQAVSKDMSKAFEYAQKACDLGNCHACANVSQMYQKGEGVAQDEAQAKKFKARAKEIYDDMTQARRTLTVNQ